MTMREITRQFPSKSVLEIWRLTWNNFMWAAICSCREVFLDTLLVQPVAQHHHKMIFDDLNVHILLAYNSRTFKDCISYFAGSECFLMPRFLYHWYGGCPTEAGQMKATANSEFVLLERGPLHIYIYRSFTESWNIHSWRGLDLFDPGTSGATSGHFTSKLTLGARVKSLKGPRWLLWWDFFETILQFQSKPNQILELWLYNSMWLEANWTGPELKTSHHKICKVWYYIIQKGL